MGGEPNGGVYNSMNLGLMSYAAQNPVRYVDPDGKSFAHALAIAAVVWGSYEVISLCLDTFNAVKTVNDPNASDVDKSIAVGGAALSLVAPGGGYGTVANAGKKVVKEIAEDAFVHTAPKEVAEKISKEGLQKGSWVTKWKYIKDKTAEQLQKILYSKEKQIENALKDPKGKFKNGATIFEVKGKPKYKNRTNNEDQVPQWQFKDKVPKESVEMVGEK